MVHSGSLEDALNRWDIRRTKSESVRTFFKAAPGNVPTQVAFSQERRFEELDTDRATGCVRDAEHAYSKDGGLAVLSGNIALEGCIVKTAGVDESILKYEGPARVFESQDASVKAIMVTSYFGFPQPLAAIRARAAGSIRVTAAGRCVVISNPA